MKFTGTLKKNYEFRRLYSKGSSAASPRLVIYARKTRAGGNSIGITVSTKLGKAVVRNKVRRRLREIYRLNEPKFRKGVQLVIVARTRAVSASYWQLEEELLSLCRRLELLKGDGQS